MTGADACPKYAGRTFLRERPDAFDRQNKRFDADGREPLLQRIAPLWRDVAEESESDVKLFNGRPTHTTQWLSQRGDGDPHRFWRRERDEEALRSVGRRGHEGMLPKSASEQSGPIEIKTDADALFVDAIRGDFVTQPALEEDNISSLGGIGDVSAIRGAGVGKFRRSGHEFAQTRIFKFQSGTTARCHHIISTTQKRQWVQMQRMRCGGRHDVHPTIGHADRATAEIHLEGASKGADVARDLFFEIRETAGETVEFIERRVARVAAGVIFFRPAATCDIEVAELPTFGGKTVVKAGETGRL